MDDCVGACQTSVNLYRMCSFFTESVFLDNMMLADLLTSSCGSVYGEETFDWQSVQLLQYDVLRLTVARCSTVAERMQVVTSNDFSSRFNRAGLEREETAKVDSSFGIDRSTSFSKNRENYEDAGLRISGLKKAFFNESCDRTKTNLGHHGKRKLSEKLADAIARFSSSNDWSKRPNDYSIETLASSGYVKSLIEKFSNSPNTSAHEHHQASPISLQNRESDQQRVSNLPNNGNNDNEEVDCRIQETPRPDFVDTIYLGPADHIDNASWITALNANDNFTRASEEGGRQTTMVIDPVDISNGNVNEAAWYPTQEWISPSTDESNESDENGNLMSHEIKTDEEGEINNCPETINDVIKMKNEKNSPIQINKNDEPLMSEDNDDRCKEIADKIQKLPRLPSKPLIHQDSVAQIISGMNKNIEPSKIVVNNLPKTDFSIKYNLDPTKMKLFYTLSPAASVEDETLENAEETKEKSLVTSPISPGSKVETGDKNAVWQDDFTTSVKLENTSESMTTNTGWKNPSKNWTEPCEVYDWSLEVDDNEWHSEDERAERISNESLGIPESLIHTIDEFERDDEESFEKDISSSANEIIAHLDIRELYVCAANIVDDVIEAVSSLDRIVPESLVDVEFVGDYKKNSLLDAAREIVAQRIELDSTNNNSEIPITETIDDSVTSSEHEGTNIHDHSSGSNSSASVIVIDEVVHHIIDKFTDKKRGISHSKKFKESTNIGIVQEMYRTSTNLSKENGSSEVIVEFQSLARRNKADNSLELNLGIESEFEKVEKNDSDLWKSDVELVKTQTHDNEDPPSMSPERQEVTTSESTENDTKSDSGKEKDGGAIIVESPRSRSQRNNTPYFCLIEYVPESRDDEEDLLDENEDSKDELPALRDPLSCIPEENSEEIVGECEERYGLGIILEDRENSTDIEDCGEETWNNTYTLSDRSEDAASGSLYCSTYNADVSSSNDDTRQTSSGIDNDEAFDTTANYADISATTGLFSRIIETSVQYDAAFEVINEKEPIEQDPAQCCPHNVSVETTDSQILAGPDCLSCSHDTNEFIRLEKELSVTSERDGCRDAPNIEGAATISPPLWPLSTSPLKSLPRYEETSLYRVVSNINLTDTISSHSEFPFERE